MSSSTENSKSDRLKKDDFKKILTEKPEGLYKTENTCSVNEVISKKPQILFKKEKPKSLPRDTRNISQGNPNNINNTTNNNPNIIFKKIKNNSSNNDYSKETVTKINPTKINKHNYKDPLKEKEKREKMNQKEIKQKLQALNDTIRKNVKQNYSYNNQKKINSNKEENNTIETLVEDNKIKENPNNNQIIKKTKIKQNSFENRIPNCNSNLKKLNTYNKTINTYSKNNSSKLHQVINTTETTKKNNSMLRNKTHESYNQSKDSKSNMSNYDKRKEYKVPPVKTKLQTLDKTEEEADLGEEEEINDENRKEIITNLMMNQEANYLRYLEKLLKNSNQGKNYKNIEIKKKYIEENGVDLDFITQENFSEGGDENDEGGVNKEENNNEGGNSIHRGQNLNFGKKMRGGPKMEEEKLNNYEKKVGRKNNFKEKKNYLNENINMNFSNSSENPIDNITNINNINIENKRQNNYNTSKYTSKNEKYPENNTLYDAEEDQQYNISKTKRKQKVNTLEFYDRIIHELNTIEKKELNQLIEAKMTKKEKPKQYYDNELETNNNDSLGESFRRKSLTKNNNNPNNYNNEISENYIDTNESGKEFGFNYSSKKNIRSKLEIKEFIEKKRKLNKCEEEKNLKNTQAKKLNKFLGLYKLQEDIKVNKRINSAKQNKNIYSNNNNNVDNNLIIKNQIPNEYYVGPNRSNFHRKNSDLSKNSETSQSTVLDENNYYLNVINSQNILSNNPNLNLIEPEKNNNHMINNKTNNNIINNINNNTNDDINNTNDTNNINNNDINNNDINNNINNEINEINEKENNDPDPELEKKLDLNEDLFIKCKDTLDKANLLFSKTKIKEMINNYKTNSYNNSNNISNNTSNINEDKNTIVNNLKNSNNLTYSKNSLSDSQKDSQEKNNIIIDTNNNLQTNSNINEEENIENDNKINTNEINNIIEKNINQINEDFEISDRNIANNEKNFAKSAKNYSFTNEDLEKYYEIFNSIADYLRLLTQRNILNDIITYGDLRYRYKIGFEQIIIVIKSFTFNSLRLIYQRQYYKAVLRQFFIPYLNRAYNTIQYYGYNKQRIIEFNNIIEQIYRIIFLKRLDFYGQITIIINQNEKKYNTSIKILLNFFRKKIFNTIYEKYLNLIANSNNKSNNSSQRYYNTFVYESFTEKSSLTAYPNSEGSAKLHNLYEMIEMQKKNKENENNNENNNEENNDNEEMNEQLVEFGPNDINNLSLTDKSNRSNKSFQKNNNLEKIKNEINNNRINNIINTNNINNNINNNDIKNDVKEDLDKSNKKEILELSPTSKDDLIKKLNENKNLNNENLNDELINSNELINNNNEINNEVISNNNEDSLKKYNVGCIKKIEITGNFKNKISEEYYTKKEIIPPNNNNNNNNKNNKSEEEENINNTKEELLNSLEFKSNIKNEVIEENDLTLNDNNNNTNKQENTEIIIDKKSRNSEKINNNNNNNTIKTDLLFKDTEIIKSLDDISNNSIGFNLSSSYKQNNNNIIINLTNNNNLRYINNNNNNQENLINKNNILNNTLKNEQLNKIINNLNKADIDNITNELTEQIIKEIILGEITDTKKHLVNKKKEISCSLNNSSVSLLVSQNSMSIGSRSPGRNYNNKNKNFNSTNNNNNESYQTISSNQVESILNNSIFMRTIEEIKKEKNLNLYNDEIAPVLIEKIQENISENYAKIVENLQNPLKIDEAKMINGLMLKDKSLSISSKIRFCNESIKPKEFINKSILKDFEKKNKEIRNNIMKSTDIFYDKILNKCIFDTANEIIEKYRMYGIIGEPLPWSIRTRNMRFKFKNDNYSLNLFKNLIIKELKKDLDVKMGLIAENYEYLDMEQLNQDRDKKFMESISSELKDNEDYYQIFETQETYVKLSLSRIIMDQLLNEIVEILEHVQYSRKEPDKYQSKSIYACEDIPRLSFQPPTMENNYSGNYEGEESINQ